MTLREFRRLVHREFGADLHRMTPANVREFLDRVQSGITPASADGRVSIDEPEKTYEGIVRDFLRRTLEMPPEQAVVLLWLYCLELVTASLSELEAQRFDRLFARLESPDEGP